MYEEIGLNIDVDKAKLIHFYDEIKEKNEKYHYIELDFLIEIDSKNIDIKLSDEHDDYLFVTKDSNLIDDYIKNKIREL